MKSRKKVCLFMLIMTLGAFNIISNDAMANDMYIDDEPMLVQDEEIKGNKEAYDKAVEAISQKDFQSAITYLTAYITSKPKKYEAYKLRGDAYYALRQYSLAEEDYKTAINLKVGDDKFITGTKYISAVVLGADKDEQLQNPELGNLYGRLMYAQKALNNPAYETAFAQATQYNSHIYLPQPKKEDIAKVNCPQKYGKALNPTGIDSYIYGAIEDIEKENYRDAVFKAQHITSNYPDYYLGYYLTGVALLGIGQEKEAVDAFNISISKNPYDFESLASLGQLYYSNAEKTFSASDAKKSNEYFNKALKYNPNCYRYYFYIGLNELQTGNFAASINNFNKAIRLKPNDYSSMYYKLIAQYAKGDYRAVLDECTNLLFKRVSNYNSVLYLRALAYNKLKSYDYALADIDTIQGNINDIYNADIKVVSEKEKTLENYLYYLKAQIMQEQGYGARADMLKAVQNPIIAKLSEVEQAVRTYSEPLNKDIISLGDYQNYNNFYVTELPKLLQSNIVITVDDIDNQYDYLRTTFDNLGLTFVYSDSGYKLSTIENYASKTYAGKLSAEDLNTLASGNVNTPETQVEKPVLKKVSSDSDIIGDMTKMSIAQMLASNSLPVMNTQKPVMQERQSLLNASEPELLTQNNIDAVEVNKVIQEPEESKSEQILLENEEISQSVENKIEDPLITETPESIKVEAPVQKPSQTFEISYPDDVAETVVNVEETVSEISTAVPSQPSIESVTDNAPEIQKPQPEKVSGINEKYAEVNPADYSLAVKSKAEMPVIDDSTEVIELELDNNWGNSSYMNISEYSATESNSKNVVDSVASESLVTKDLPDAIEGRVEESSETEAVIVKEEDEAVQESVAVPVVIVPELNIENFPRKSEQVTATEEESMASNSVEQVNSGESFNDFISKVKEEYSDSSTPEVKKEIEIAENIQESVMENNLEVQNIAENSVVQGEQIQIPVDEKAKRKAEKEFNSQLKESMYINLADEGMLTLIDQAKEKQALKAEKLAKKQEKLAAKEKIKTEKQQARVEAARLEAEARLAKEQQKAEEREIVLREKMEQKSRKEAERVQLAQEKAEQKARAEAEKLVRAQEKKLAAKAAEETRRLETAQKAAECEAQQAQRAAELAEQKARQEADRVARAQEKELAAKAAEETRKLDAAQKAAEREAQQVQRAAELAEQKVRQEADRVARAQEKELAAKAAEETRRLEAAQKAAEREAQQAQRAAELAEQKARQEAERVAKAQEKELAAKAAEETRKLEAAQKAAEREAQQAQRAADLAEQKARQEAERIAKAQEKELATKAVEEARLYQAQQKEVERQVALTRKAVEAAAAKEQREADLIRKEAERKAAEEAKILKAQQKQEEYQAELAQKAAMKAADKERLEAERLQRVHDQELASKAAAETKRLQAEEKMQKQAIINAEKAEQKARLDAERAVRAQEKELAAKAAEETRRLESAQKAAEREAQQAQRAAELASQRARAEAERIQRAQEKSEQRAREEAERAVRAQEKELAAKAAEETRRLEAAQKAAAREAQQAQRSAELAEQRARQEAERLQRAQEKSEQRAREEAERVARAQEKELAAKAVEETRRLELAQKAAEREAQQAQRAAELASQRARAEAERIQRAQEKSEQKAREEAERAVRAQEKAEQETRQEAEKAELKAKKLVEYSIKQQEKAVALKSAQETKEYLNRQKEYERQVAAARKAVEISAKKEQRKADLINKAEEKAERKAEIARQRKARAYEKEVLSQVYKDAKEREALQKAAERQAKKDKKAAAKAAEKDRIAEAKLAKTKDKELRERAAAETKSYLDYERKMLQERLKAEKDRIAAQKKADKLVKMREHQVQKNLDKELKVANAQKKAAEKIAEKERKEAIKAAKAQEIANQKHLKSLISENTSEHKVGLKKNKKKFNFFGWFKKSNK